MLLCSFCISQRRVLPAILGVDVGAVLDQALGDVDPAVEGGDVERGAVVVIPSVDEGAILLEELPDGGDVVLVGVPEDEGRPADPGLLLLLLLVGGPRQGRGWGGGAGAGAAGGIGAATAAAHGGNRIGADRICLVSDCRLFFPFFSSVGGGLRAVRNGFGKR